MTAEKNGAPIEGLRWLQTMTGRAWHPTRPDLYPYYLPEIALGLARLPRFNGQTKRGFEAYSVAQHSVFVARRAMQLHELKPSVPALSKQAEAARCRALCRAALLHDAAETFCLDLPRPVKELPELAGYREIASHFGLSDWTNDPLIKQADNELLATEQRDVMGPCAHAWAPLPDPLKDEIVPWTARLAEVEFLNAWVSYGGSLDA